MNDANADDRNRGKWNNIAWIVLNLIITISISQFLSFMLCLTGVFSQSLSQFHNINTPTIQNAISYSLLTIFYLPLFLVQKIILRKPWNTPWYIYPLISLCDSIANYLVVKAYAYTSITSVQLLDCLSIPNVLVLSFIFLRRKYVLVHFVGVILCVIGVIVVIVGEAKFSNETMSFDTKAVLGDLLCIAGSVCYAISNVSQEFVILRLGKQQQVQVNAADDTSQLQNEATDAVPDADENSPIHSPITEKSETNTLTTRQKVISLLDNMVEYLALTGFFGVIYSLMITAIIERQEVFIYTHKQPVNVYLYLGGFALSMFGFSTFVPVLLFRASATFMNLSFLSSDLWALIVSLVLFGGRGVTWYWASATVLVVAGIVVYHLRGDGYRPEEKLPVNNDDSQEIETQESTPNTPQDI
jgi:solute carrier family 35 protein F1/2